MSHFVAYILQFQEIIVYKIPPGGEGVYSQPKVYNIIGEPTYKYGQQAQVTVRNHNRSTALERSVLKYPGA